MNQRVLVGGILAAALTGLLFGFDTAVISGVTGALRDQFALTPTALGLTVSSALWGTLLGAATAGYPGDRYGCRDSLKLMSLLYLVSSIGCALAWNWPSLLIFRFIAGIGIGGSSVLAPVYISEIAPPSRRGALVGLFQANIVLGILVAYLSNFLLGGLELGAEEWRWKLAVTAAPAAFLYVLLRHVPQSPRWLVSKQRLEEAASVLRLISPTAKADLENIIGDVERDIVRKGQKLSWRLHRRPMLLAISLAMFNQLAGINAILYYLNDIFTDAGFGKVSADTQAVVIGATNLAFTLLAVLVIDKIGRKMLLLVGSVVMIVALGATARIMSTGQHQDLLLWFLVAYIAGFAFSQGAVIWVYISEIFPTSVRARGQSLGSSTHWLMNALVSGLFPAVAAYSKGAPFIGFSAMMAVQFLTVLFFFPETKGVSLENMEQTLDAH